MDSTKDLKKFKMIIESKLGEADSSNHIKYKIDLSKVSIDQIPHAIETNSIDLSTINRIAFSGTGSGSSYTRGNTIVKKDNNHNWIDQEGQIIPEQNIMQYIQQEILRQKNAIDKHARYMLRLLKGYNNGASEKAAKQYAIWINDWKTHLKQSKHGYLPKKLLFY